MRHHNSYLLISLLLTSIFTGNSRGDIHHVKVPTAVLADSNRTIIATPSTYDSQRPARYPVILMLHGWSGDETQWEDDADLQMLANRYDLLLVLPDGGYAGWWADSQTQPKRNYERHIVDELLPWLEQHYNATQSKNQRGLTGLSMGGYGSIALLLRNPDVFGAAASLSGITDIIAHGTQWGLLEAFGDQEVNAEYWRAHNPLTMIDDLRGRKIPPIFIICGAEDFAFQENLAMAELLNEKGAKFLALFPPGTHSHPFWKEYIGEAIRFIVNQIQD
ncbi:MAG: esterase family protein [Candidatus Marinimicrobia bacterium]|nr:esterase family protein [Candidatus Neomarinimicrobiota bacterium]MCF7839352.1 esterase family protein [Candidatus Neomarinimicrobiota bacterium]MCF7901955.1 esterase family protein [Candidatus Neomarinimicrobiota bacterium]